MPPWSASTSTTATARTPSSARIPGRRAERSPSSRALRVVNRLAGGGATHRGFPAERTGTGYAPAGSMFTSPARRPVSWSVALLPPILGCPSLLIRRQFRGAPTSSAADTARRQPKYAARLALRRAVDGFGVDSQPEFFEHLGGVGAQPRGGTGDLRRRPAKSGRHTGKAHRTVGGIQRLEKPDGVQMGIVEQRARGLERAAGISSSRNSANHSSVVRSPVRSRWNSAIVVA